MMNRTPQWTLISIFLVALVSTLGCRSNKLNNEKFWKVQRPSVAGSERPAPTPPAVKYVPERVVSTPSQSKRPGQLPSLQMQMKGSSRTAAPTSAVSPARLGAYILKPNDPIIINISGPIEKQYEDIIDEQGNLNFTYIGEVMAAGKTGTQLEREIERLYLDNKIYKQLSVNIVVPTKFYFIRGNVRGPNRYPLIGRVTLMQAIAAAGGFNEFANPKKIILTRGDTTEEINFNDIQKNPARDRELLSGDSIYVPRSIF